MAHPLRIQRKRTNGWRMPECAVYCGRPSPFGNPFTVTECRAAGFTGTDVELQQRCKDAFTVWLGQHWRENWDGDESERRRAEILRLLPTLRGKQLACWCGLDEPCHVDVLAELANREVIF